MGKVFCSECGRDLSPEERLIDAIFGDPRKGSLCGTCKKTDASYKCTKCGEPTGISYNGEPFCPRHLPF